MRDLWPLARSIRRCNEKVCAIKFFREKRDARSSNQQVKIKGSLDHSDYHNPKWYCYERLKMHRKKNVCLNSAIIGTENRASKKQKTRKDAAFSNHCQRNIQEAESTLELVKRYKLRTNWGEGEGGN